MIKVKFYVDTDTLPKNEQTAHRVYFHKVLMVDPPYRGSAAEMVLLKAQLLAEETKAMEARASKTKGVRESDEYRQVRSQMFSENQKKNGGKIVCGYCGRTCNRTHMDPHQATVDHIVPLSENGASIDRDNLLVCCRTCNRAKRYFTGSVEEYRKIRTQKRIKEEGK